jgi:folate-binding protein YgfZ
MENFVVSQQHGIENLIENTENNAEAALNSELHGYWAARTSVAWRDCSRMGKVLARGTDRLDLLQRMTTNDLATLKGTATNGDGAQTVVVTDKARIVDVATVLARENDVLMLLSEGMDEHIIAWLDKYTFADDFVTRNVTAELGAVMLCGPRSAQLLKDWSGVSVAELRIAHWRSVEISGVQTTLVKMPTLCELCYVLLCPKASMDALLSVLRSFGGDVPELSEEAFEVLRIEAGWGRLGAEWTDAHNPLEAALVSLVNFTKGCYIGQEVIARLDTYNKVKMRLVGFTSSEAIPVGAKFFDAASAATTGAEIGSITSAAYSPELKCFIALGYIRTAFANPGASMEAVADGKTISVEIAKLPLLM